MATPPSGEQFEIAHGRQRATIVEVGAGIRTYEDGGRAVLDSYDRGTICDGAHGSVLIPWPNRIAEGRYGFEGRDYQLDLSEPARGNAIHGLMRWRPWRALEQGPARVELGAHLHPQPGYPFELDLTMTYELGDEGLSVMAGARNAGERPCPYGFGQHPYLSAGEGSLEACTLQLSAATHLPGHPEQRVPLGRRPVAGTELDFAAGRTIGSLVLDDTLTDLARDREGRAWARLTGGDGATVELWAGERLDVMQLFSGDTLAAGRRRRALAVEPMTCAPNAFRTGDGLAHLEPGEWLGVRWGVRLRT